MANDLKLKYGTSNQAITITLNSLGNNNARESTYVDNGTNLFFDAQLMVVIQTATSSTSATGYVNVYAYGSADGGTTYDDNCTGSDTAITLDSPTNLVFLGTITANANSTVYTKRFNVAAALGPLPARWGIVIENKTGASLHSSGNSAHYQGLLAQAA